LLIITTIIAFSAIKQKKYLNSRHFDTVQNMNDPPIFFRKVDRALPREPHTSPTLCHRIVSETVSRDFAAFFHMKNMKFLIGPDQVYFSFL
jgi:hypothetical protein